MSIKWIVKRLFASAWYQLIMHTVLIGLGVYFIDIATDLNAAYSYCFG